MITPIVYDKYHEHALSRHLQLSIKDLTSTTLCLITLFKIFPCGEDTVEHFQRFRRRDYSHFNMDRLLLTVTLSLVAFLYFELDIANAQEPTCKQVLGDLTKKQLSGISTCSKSMKFKDGKDKGKKMNCILKCVMMNEKVLDEKGYFDSNALNALILSKFPPSLHDKANATFSPCAEKAAGIDPSPETDEYCKSYDPFIKCLLGSMPTMCG